MKMNELSYKLYMGNDEVIIHSLKETKPLIWEYLYDNPNEVVSVYRGKKLYARYVNINSTIYKSCVFAD